MRRRAVTVVAAFGLSMILGVFSATPALADRSVHSPDDGAVAAWKSRPDHLHVKDNKCDGRSVYAKYKLHEPSTGWRRFDNDEGCGHIAIDVVQVGRSRYIEYLVCTNIRFGRDRCSSSILETT
jgi:hypothetical protein